MGLACAGRQAIHLFIQAVQVVGNRLQLGLALLQRIQVRTENLGTRQLAQIPGDVLARRTHTHVFTIQAVMVMQMLQQQAPDFANQGRGQMRAGLQKVRNFAKYPRTALGGAANHQRIRAGKGQHRTRFFPGCECRRWQPPECARRL